MPCSEVRQRGSRATQEALEEAWARDGYRRGALGSALPGWRREGAAYAEYPRAEADEASLEKAI